jgi:hypothetical protein
VVRNGFASGSPARLCLAERFGANPLFTRRAQPESVR